MKLTEKEFFDRLKGKGYSRFHMKNSYLNTMRSDRVWIVNKETKQTIGHYRDSHYNGKGDFTIYEIALEEKPKIETSKTYNVPNYTFDSLSLETIEEYLKAIFYEKAN